VNVTAYTGGWSVSSARFRVRQYVQPLAKLGLAIDERWPAFTAYPPRTKSLRVGWFAATLTQRFAQVLPGRRSDVVLFQKELISTVPTIECLIRRPCVVDIDDAIHLFRGGWAARRLGAQADLVVVGNEWLAEVWGQWCPSVEVLPTAVDTVKYQVAPWPDAPVIGWIGDRTNLRYLTAIAPALAQVAKRFPQVTIAVCSNGKPDLPGLPVLFTPWSIDAEERFLASLSIGIMPLADGLWERGKCAFKMLQYMATGRPSVVSPMPMNAKILSQAEVGLAATTIREWTDALCGLLSDSQGAQRMGETGRRLAVEAYSVNALAPRFAAHLRRLT
jgi:glycosyltransferase involved in cell wall biosynthesis